MKDFEMFQHLTLKPVPIPDSEILKENAEFGDF